MTVIVLGDEKLINDDETFLFFHGRKVIHGKHLCYKHCKQCRNSGPEISIYSRGRGGGGGAT